MFLLDIQMVPSGVSGIGYSVKQFSHGVMVDHFSGAVLVGHFDRFNHTELLMKLLMAYQFFHFKLLILNSYFVICKNCIITVV